MVTKSLVIAVTGSLAVLLSANSAHYAQSPTASLPAAQPTIIVSGQNAGPTPFIENLELTANPPDAVRSIAFAITPKPGSVTRPVSATYTADYLQSRGYLNTQSGAITLPVFGLYAAYSNTVTLTATFSDNSTQQINVSVTTGAYTDQCGYSTPIIFQGRTSDTSLSYDYIMIKNNCGTQSPVIIDTDGAVRWVGTAGVVSLSSMFFSGGIYISAPPPGSSTPTGIGRMEFDGTYTFVKDYSSMGITSTGHHNYDPGKQGMLVDVNTTQWTESVVMEVDPFGNVLKTWNLAQIISDAMTAGGDDPTQFVQPAPNDWFHMNAATYRSSDNTLIVSSRENFVIGLDYDSGAIKWILGDPTKQWYQFPSLRQYALSLGANTLPPIGQHAVSITYDDNLLLFDDGFGSVNHSPSGVTRSYSTPRKYHLDLQNNVATEIWNYTNGESIDSEICSSVYEDQPLNYLIDYATASPNAPILMGLNSAGNKVFDYRYSASGNSGCGLGWNAIPIHLERVAFTNPPLVNVASRMTHGSAGTFDIDLPIAGPAGVEPRTSSSLGAGNYKLIFTFANNIAHVGAANVTSGTGSIASKAIGPNPNQYTVNLRGVSNAQTVSVTLTNVVDSQNNTGSITVPMRVLIGDATGNGVVDSGDVFLVRQHTGQSVDRSNFREDVNTTGVIDSGDVFVTRQHTGSSVP